MSKVNSGSGTGQRWAFPAILVLMAVGLGSSGSPAPLYALYAREFDFAPIITTLVFAIYAVTALVSILSAGALSDRHGRKPLLVGAAVLLLAGTVTFLYADSAGWLLVARALHGFAVGAIVVAGSAALLDLRPGQGARTGKFTGAVFNVGIGASLMIVALIAQFGKDPLHTPFLVMGGLAVLLLVTTLCLREPHTEGRATTLRIAWPSVPAEITADFRFAVIGAIASWSMLGVFLSLFPKIASDAIGTDNLVVGAAIVAVSAFTGAVSQFVGVLWTPRIAAVVGDIGTAVCLLACIPAVATGNGWVIGGASATLGFFFGLAFGSSLRHLGDVVPAGRRGEVMSAFYVGAYGALAVPTLLAGWAATVWSPEQIFAPFLALVACGSLAAAVLGWTLDAPDADVDLDD